MPSKSLFEHRTRSWSDWPLWGYCSNTYYTHLTISVGTYKMFWKYSIIYTCIVANKIMQLVIVVVIEVGVKLKYFFSGDVIASTRDKYILVNYSYLVYILCTVLSVLYIIPSIMRYLYIIMCSLCRNCRHAHAL